MLDFCYRLDYKEFIIEYYFKNFFFIIFSVFYLIYYFIVKKTEDLFVLSLCYKDNGIYFFLLVKGTF